LEVSFKDKELEKCARDFKFAIKQMGRIRSKIYLQRIQFLLISPNFQSLRLGPGHFHELTGNRSGEWACDLDQPYRLVFRAGENADGKKWIEIASAEILEIVDYHK